MINTFDIDLQRIDPTQYQDNLILERNDSQLFQCPILGFNETRNVQSFTFDDMVVDYIQECNKDLSQPKYKIHNPVAQDPISKLEQQEEQLNQEFDYFSLDLDLIKTNAASRIESCQSLDNPKLQFQSNLDINQFFNDVTTEQIENQLYLEDNKSEENLVQDQQQEYEVRMISEEELKRRRNQKVRKSKEVYKIFNSHYKKDQNWSRELIIELALRLNLSTQQVYKWNWDKKKRDNKKSKNQKLKQRQSI
ncbi:hox domain containing protein [Stylonychia lemnae]|uniref:Hox domain containing protein n=1 Tax=Stylonychia lemnae TaxID=5949 RepID=A0A077ZS58_STYLE|nr:hox domain containing protein [Stylonychia lemnae]|eukprot:CDW72733.1 hox domain containing protein [Stylonychia lemnae]